MPPSLELHPPARRELLRAALALTLGPLADLASASTGLGLKPPWPKDAPVEPSAAPETGEAACMLYF